MLTALALLVSARLAWTSVPPGEVTLKTPVYDLLEPLRNPQEHWTYSFHWSGVPVATVTVTSGELDGGGPRRVELFVRGKTNAFLDLFWRYRLNAEGTIQVDPFRPGDFKAEEAIKNARKLTTIEFDDDRYVRTHRNKNEKIKDYEFAGPNTYDVPSTVYAVLNLELEVGETYHFDTLTGTARFLVDIDVQAREEIDVADASHDSFRLAIRTAEITEPEDSDKHGETLLWVSAARPRRLLLAKSKLFVGAVYAELVSAETLDQWPWEPPRIELGERRPGGSGKLFGRFRR